MHSGTHPFFKILAPNDTGASKGHQGGMVIPKEIRKFFPGLSGITSIYLPTLERRVSAMLFVDGVFLESVNARYQFQTWGGIRTAESRLTDNLGPLRNRASGGDLLVIQRRMGSLDQYRLMLVTKNNSDYVHFKEKTLGKRWGLLSGSVPLSTEDLETAEKAEKENEERPFNIFDIDAKMAESTSTRVARSIVFTRVILALYNRKCCVCGEGLVTRKGAVEVQADILFHDPSRDQMMPVMDYAFAFDIIGQLIMVFME